MARIRTSAEAGSPRRSAASTRTRRAVGAGSTSQARDATSQAMSSWRSRSPAWPACSAAAISAAARVASPSGRVWTSSPIQVARARWSGPGSSCSTSRSSGRTRSRWPSSKASSAAASSRSARWPGRAQLRGPLERGDRDRQRAAPPRAPGGLLQLVGDLFMGTADQRRAMPDAAVRLCPQYLGKRLVHAAALQQARALAHRRPDQRVAEAHAVEVEIDDRGLGGRFEQLKPQRCPGQHAGRVDDIAEPPVVAVRGDQQEQPGRLRQIGYAGREGPLEPLGERQHPSGPAPAVPRRTAAPSGRADCRPPRSARGHGSPGKAGAPTYPAAPSPRRGRGRRGDAAAARHRRAATGNLRARRPAARSDRIADGGRRTRARPWSAGQATAHPRPGSAAALRSQPHRADRERPSRSGIAPAPVPGSARRPRQAPARCAAGSLAE